MIEYVLLLIAVLLGVGVGWLIWGRASVDVLPSLSSVGQATKRTREIRRPKLESVTAHAGPSPFRVVLLSGEVVYDGISGSEARRHIERIRDQDLEWRAYRGGIAWDWGPRV